MYTPSWLSDEPLIASLLNAPWQWSAAQAHRILERTGTAIKYHTDSCMNYPLGEINNIDKTGTGWQIQSTLHALNGYNGALPYSYQDLERYQRLTDDNLTLKHFFSLFNHKILHLSQQVSLNSCLSVSYEKYHYNRLSKWHPIQTIMGVSSAKHLPSNNLIQYAAVLSQKTTSLKTLTYVLNDYFLLSFHFEPPPLVKMPLADDCLTRLHSRMHNASQAPLGSTTSLGKSCYLLSSTLKLIISVSTAAEYRKITKDSTLAPAILELCSMYFSNSAHIQLQIQCPRMCLQSPRLSTKEDTSFVGRLGRHSCLVPELHPDALITVDYSQS